MSSEPPLPTRGHEGFQGSPCTQLYLSYLNSGIPALVGFFLSAVVARVYPVEGARSASAGISVVTLLMLLSTLGLTYELARSLPSVGEKGNHMINSCFTIVATATTPKRFTRQAFIANRKEGFALVEGLVSGLFRLTPSCNFGDLR